MSNQENYFSKPDEYDPNKLDPSQVVGYAYSDQPVTQDSYSDSTMPAMSSNQVPSPYIPSGQSIYINQVPTATPTNGLGVGGFVVALIAFFFVLVPGLGAILWVIGTVLSAVALGKAPRGLAIAGTAISVFTLIFFLVLLSLPNSIIHEIYR